MANNLSREGDRYRVAGVERSEPPENAALWGRCAPPQPPAARHGAVLIMVLGCVAIASIVFMSIVRVVSIERRSVQKETWRVEATWLAESGLQRAAAKLAADPDYAGETWNLTAEQLDLPDTAVVKIEVEEQPDAPNRRTVRVRADYPNHPQHRCRHTKSLTVWLPTPENTDKPSEDAPEDAPEGNVEGSVEGGTDTNTSEEEP